MEVNEQIFQDIERSSAKEHWSKIGIRHHHGINIPLFSLKSSSSAGIGEYPDLIPLLDWCHRLGLDCLQLLPLNDTGIENSPYSAISAFALNPIHIGILHLPFLDRHDDLRAQMRELQNQNLSQKVNYGFVRERKDQILREYFQKEKKKFLSSGEFQVFKEKNSWLKGYALFKAIKISTDWQSWTDWSTDLKEPSPKEFQLLCNQYKRDIEFFEFEQYICAKQLREVKEYAFKLGIFIKGDIPILINRESADVWQNPSLFFLSLSAGAPPDMYSKEGQNWGFPVYNWEKIKKTDYQWWKERLQCASEFYDLYRIDHAVGFFRIWAIPLGKLGQEGHYVPHDPNEWMELGEENMHMMLQASLMLPIAEDLGNVPPEVRMKLRELGILGTKVMRWERRWEEDRGFINPEEYTPLSMTTVSTHDSDTLQLWWINSPDEAEEFCRFKNWQYRVPLSLDCQRQILWDSHHSASLFHINLLNEYLPLFSELVWPNPEDERINIPGIISEKNWTYRFRPTIEEITSHQGLADAIKELIHNKLHP